LSEWHRAYDHRHDLHYLYLGHRPPLLPGIRNQIVLEFSQIYIKSSLKPNPTWGTNRQESWFVLFISFMSLFCSNSYSFCESAYFSFFYCTNLVPIGLAVLPFIGYRQAKYIRLKFKELKTACFFQYYTWN